MNFADITLGAAFLFTVGSILGWVVEVFCRRAIKKKWINPGFLTGPYLPLYGFGLTGLFALSMIRPGTGFAALDAAIVILIMGAAMTFIEYIAGLIFIKGLKIKLWDYSHNRGNIQGIICPLYSFFWLLISAAFYFIASDRAVAAIVMLVRHRSMTLTLGLVLGVMLVDLGNSLNISVKIRKFAKEHDLVVHFERLKESIRDRIEQLEKKRASFCFPFKSRHKLNDELLHYSENRDKK